MNESDLPLQRRVRFWWRTFCIAGVFTVLLPLLGYLGSRFPDWWLALLPKPDKAAAIAASIDRILAPFIVGSLLGIVALFVSIAALIRTIVIGRRLPGMDRGRGN